MSAKQMTGVGLAAGGAAMALVLAAGPNAAQAAVISTSVATLFTKTSTVVSFGSGAATYTFSAIAGALAGNPPAAVATGGSAMVSSFLGGVTDFAAGATINQTGQLYKFSTFSTASTIPDSAADDFIGLAFTLADGLHYGYAEVSGTELVSYGYQSTANTTILTGATTAVPEPSTLVLLAGGLAGLGVLRMRRTRTHRSAA